MTIYFDENESKLLAQALDLLQQKLNKKMEMPFTVKRTVEEFGSGALDQDLFETIGKAGNAIITRDRDVVRRCEEAVIAQRSGLKRFLVVGINKKKPLSFWDVTVLLVNAWQEILEKCQTEEGPFVYVLKPGEPLKEWKLGDWAKSA